MSTGEKKPMVLIFCPVCEVAIRNSKKWLVQHMLKHGQVQEVSRPCQMCIDQASFSDVYGPGELFSHINSAHHARIMWKRKISCSACLPVHPASADVWEFVEREGEQWVVCPWCPSSHQAQAIKPKNIARHLARSHILSYRDRLCPGCKVAVTPDQLVNHTACKNSNQPIATDEAPLKRKVDTTDATRSSLKSAKVASDSATMQNLLLLQYFGRK